MEWNKTYLVDLAAELGLDESMRGVVVTLISVGRASSRRASSRLREACCSSLTRRAGAFARSI